MGDGAISPGLSREIARKGREVLGLEKWPPDVLRHTFATYHVAAFNDPGKTSLLLGHEGNPSLLHRHYRGLATQAEAIKFWNLRP
jgi:integrase